MKDISKTYSNFNNNMENNHNHKFKSIYKEEKLKNESKLKENSPKKDINPIKNININFNVPKNIYCKKRANSYYDNEKNTFSNNETITSKKLINNTSYIKERNNNNIFVNSKFTKKSEIKKNKHIYINNNSSNNKLRKKIMINKRNYSNDNANTKCINSIGISQTDEEKLKYINFNNIYNNMNNNDKNKKRKINFSSLSLSQNIDNKNNSFYKKLNKELSSSIDYANKLITETDKECELISNKNYYYLNNLKNSFDSNNLYINDYSNKIKDVENYNYYNYNNGFKISNNNSRNKYQPIKLYNDNTTINLGGSYNFHQYFNTIISNKNNDVIYASNHKRNNVSTNFENKSPTQTKNIINHIYNKAQDKVRYCNTQLNSNNTNNKTNKIFFNDTLIHEINDIEEEMNKNLKQNPTNSKSKKYNTLKNFFEKLLKCLNNYFYNNELNSLCNYLQKLLIGYHEVVCAYSEENLKLKELNFKLTEQYEKIDKSLIECNKNIKEKQKKIEILENKINGFVNKMKNKNVIREYHINMNQFDLKKNNDEQNNKIKKINEKNLDDLDALYFFDKIETKHQRSFSSGKFIPLLPINKKKNNI